ncbi:MAG: hypothetical protein AAF658_11560 [Myxococcota bacterium]
MRIWCSAVLLALLGACGQDNDEPGDPEPVPAELAVINKTQFEVLELYTHPGLEHGIADNLLDAPLAIESMFVIPRVPGNHHLTYVRTERGLGDLFSITTDAPLALPADGFALWLFDEGFRLLDPDHPENPMR